MKRLLVDGYNVIRQVPPYRQLAEGGDLDGARRALIADVAAYAQGEWDATIVFDGRGNPHSAGEPQDALGVTVVFSPYGVEADAVIESLARRAREKGEVAEVVTSDAQTQWAVMGGAVTRRSAGEFGGDLGHDGAEWREHSPTGSSRTRVEDRIPSEVRDALKRMVDKRR